MSKVYLAGPMRGIPLFNYPAFDMAAERLRKQGHFVFNPAERDRKRDGKDWGNEAPNGDLATAQAKGFNLRDALGDDMSFICREADAIALLPGWEDSKGARAEHATAVALGLEIIKL